MRVTDHREYQNYHNKYWQAGQNEHAADNTGRLAAEGMDRQGIEAGNRAETAAGARAGAMNAAEARADGTTAGKGSETLPAYLQESRFGESEQPGDLIEQLRQQAEAFRKSYQSYRSQTLYSSTSDLMAIANTESADVLRSIYVRLSFKLWSVRAAGATGTSSKAVKSATRSVERSWGR